MKIIGHRGARGLAPENTLASLQKAIEHGVHAVEFDVRVTKDMVPILLHDPHLVDPPGNILRISHHTLKELRRHKPDLATLADVLNSLDKKVLLRIEIKPAEPVAPIAKVIRAALKSGRHESTLAFASFSYKTLKDFKREFPNVMLVVNDRWSGMRATRRARRLGTRHIAMNEMWLWSGFVRAMSTSGYQLYPYTMNNKTKAERWKRHGLAGLYTDYPDRFRN